MSKDIIRRLIGDSIVVEERSIPIYTRHLKDSLFWSPFSPKEEESIKSKLQILESQSEEHVILLRKLGELLREEQCS